MSAIAGLPPHAFDKADPSSDTLFYQQPRLVTHIDDGAIAAVTETYRRTLRPGGVILDLMSSWVSHLPPEVDYQVQYLQEPVAVFAEVARLLQPGAPLVASFSNRCFPTKAVAIWQALSGPDQQRLVSLYMDRAGFVAVETHASLPRGGDPLWTVIGRAPAA